MAGLPTRSWESLASYNLYPTSNTVRIYNDPTDTNPFSLISSGAGSPFASQSAFGINLAAFIDSSTGVIAPAAADVLAGLLATVTELNQLHSQGAVAADFAKLHALTATAAEIDQIHGVTPGTAAASLAAVLDANAAIAGLKIALGGAATTAASAPSGNLSDPTVGATGGTQNAQNTEYTLNTLSFPASAFNRTGQSIYICAWGVLAANANAKTLKLYFGTQVVATVTGNTDSGTPFTLEAVVTRTGASTQAYHGWVSVNGTLVAEVDGTATQTDTAVITIKDTSDNTAAAAASATGNGMVVQVNN